MGQFPKGNCFLFFMKCKHEERVKKLDYKMLMIDGKKCVACGICEIACGSSALTADQFTTSENGERADLSFKTYKELAAARAKIKVIPFKEFKLHLPVACFQCEDAACARACVNEAIQFNPQTGAYEVNPDACIGCRLCVMACPFGGIHFDALGHQASKCNFCGGDPQCAASCPTGAIQYKEMGSSMMQKKRETAEKFLKYVTGLEKKEA